MSRSMRPSESRQALLTASTYLERFIHDFEEVTSNLRDWRADARVGSGGPTAKNAISDPTGAAALDDDEFARMYRRLNQRIARIVSDAKDLESIRRSVTSPLTATPEPEERGLAACANIHGCPDERWAEKVGRCDTCYRYYRRVGQDRRETGARMILRKEP